MFAMILKLNVSNYILTQTIGHKITQNFDNITEKQVIAPRTMDTEQCGRVLGTAPKNSEGDNSSGEIRGLRSWVTSYQGGGPVQKRPHQPLTYTLKYGGKKIRRIEL